MEQFQKNFFPLKGALQRQKKGHKFQHFNNLTLFTKLYNRFLQKLDIFLNQIKNNCTLKKKR